MFWCFSLRKNDFRRWWIEWGLVCYVDFAICMHIKAFSRCNLVILFEFKIAHGNHESVKTQLSFQKDSRPLQFQESPRLINLNSFPYFRRKFKKSRQRSFNCEAIKNVNICNDISFNAHSINHLTILCSTKNCFINNYRLTE